MATVSDVTNIPESGVDTIDALLDNGPGWNYQTSGESVLYFCFGDAVAQPGSLTNIGLFNASQIAAARQALNYIETITGLDFVETANTTLADFHFASANIVDASVSGFTAWEYSYSYTSGNVVTDYDATAYVYLDIYDFTENTNPAAGTSGYQVLLHELGHALGLKHPFEGSPTLPANLDDTDHTLMSYTWVGGNKTVFQEYDLDALWWIYGGDGLGGTYGINSSVGPTLPGDTPPVDVTPPTVTAFTPADEATGVPVSANIIIEFSEPIQRGTGNLVLKTSAGATLATYNAATSGNLTFSGSTLTINPTADLAFGTGYRLEVAAGSIKDLSGNSYVGTTSYNFTTEMNSLPVAANAVATVNEDEVLSGSLPLATDGNGHAVTYARVANPGHGAATVNADGTYFYFPAANFHGSDNFAYSVSDGFGGSNTYTVSVTVTPVNDAPLLAVALADQAAQPASSFSYTVSAASFTDIDNPTLNYSAALANSSPLPAWLHFDPASRTFSGTPSGADAGTLEIRLTATDAGGLSASDIFSLTVGNRQTGTPGNDRLISTAGDEFIDGEGGIDTAVFGGNRSNYSLALAQGGSTVHDNVGAGGTDTLTAVERLEFADRKVAIDLLPTQNAGQALAFIGTLAFELIHVPAVVGVILPYFDQGETMTSLSQLAIDVGLVRALAGSDSNADLASLAYRNVIGQQADAVIVDTLTGFMDGRFGNYTQAGFIAAVASLDINLEHIGLVGLQQTGIEFA